MFYACFVLDVMLYASLAIVAAVGVAVTLLAGWALRGPHGRDE